MNVRDVIEVFVRYRTDQPVVLSPGTSNAVLYELGHREPTLYAGSLAYAAPVCFGLAMTRPDLKVVAIEGDGSLIAGLSFLTTLARYPLKNLTVLVIDNGTYLSTGRGELLSATASGTDLHAMAKGAGIQKAVSVSTVERLEEWLKRAFHEDGPFVIVAKVDRSGRQMMISDPRRPDRTEAAMIFHRWLMEHRLDSNEQHGTSSNQRKDGRHSHESDQGSGLVIYRALQEAGINFLVYLPDSVTYPIQELAETDPEMLTVCCGREDEGVAIASGACFGGLCPSIVMEGSGVGY